MCFYIIENHEEKKIAKFDIPCWKILKLEKVKWYRRLFKKPQLFSFYFDHIYELNKLYETKLGQKTPIYHNNGHKVCQKIINQGFHSFSSKDEEVYYLFDSNLVTIEGYIPKGAEYYENPIIQEYVSNKIILTKRL